MHIPRSTGLLLAGVLFLGAMTARAAPTDEDRKTAAGLVELAQPMVARGSYFDAIKELKDARDLDPESWAAGRLLAQAYEETGELDRALDVLGAFPGDVEALTLRARVLAGRGRLDDAAASLAAALEKDPTYVPAHTRLGALHEIHGRREEALASYKEANRLWARSEDTEDTDDVIIAEAEARLGAMRLSTARKVSLNSVLDRLEPVLRRSEHRLDAVVMVGMIYLDNHDDIHAKEWFKKARDRNAHYAPAIHGGALQLAFRYDTIQAAEECDRALRENHSFVPAMLFNAKLRLADSQYEDAEALIGKALAVNPVLSEARAAHAALSFLRGDTEAFEAQVAEILALNPHAGVAYRFLAEVLEDHRRFAEALSYAEKAVEVDPLDFSAMFLAGRNALNVGDDDRADEWLRRAEKEDVFANRIRANFLKLHDKIAKFPRRGNGDFVVRVPPREDTAYWPLLREGLDWSIALLRERWEFEPETPLMIYVFDSADDFAVRTTGLTGFPALGACFGKVVTLDSPRALGPGVFSWRMVAHHELAHVITLQLSRGRIPRWLTEGISVYEERKVGATWNRDMERDLVDAIASDEVLTLANVNSAFRGPRVIYAYFQGGLMCELIERDFGFPKLREMVRLYGEGLQTPQVVRRALGIEPEEFDRRFLEFARDYVKDVHVMPRVSNDKMRSLKRELRKTPKDLEKLLLFAMGHVVRNKTSDALQALAVAREIAPDDPRIAAVRARVSWLEGRPDKAVEFAEDAVARGADYFELRSALGTHYATPRVGEFDKAKAHLRRAIELQPREAGPGSPRLALAGLLFGEGDERLDDAMRLLEDHVAVDENDRGSRTRLAGWYRSKGDEEREFATLLHLRELVPLPFAPGPGSFVRQEAVDLHERIGDLSMKRSDWAGAALAYHLAVECAVIETADGDIPLPDDARSDLLVRHAEALRSLGRTDDSRARLREALVLDPENEDAQRLLDALDQ